MSELYLIEFFVDRLLIDYQTAKDAGGDAAYMLKMTAIGFPSVDIHPVKNSEGVNYFSKGGNNSERSLGLDLRAGKAFHIASPPLDLVKKMANNPLSIRLFREGDSFPLSTAEVPLSGCLCDQVSATDRLIHACGVDLLRKNDNNNILIYPTRCLLHISSADSWIGLMKARCSNRMSSGAGSGSWIQAVTLRGASTSRSASPATGGTS